MKLIIFFIFYLVISVVAEKLPKKVEEARGCERISKNWEDSLKYCSDISRFILKYYKYFQNTTVGHREALEMDTLTLSLVCDWYEKCSPTHNLGCYLPRLFREKDFICQRINVLRSPFGGCLRKFLTQVPKSKSLRKFIEGVDKQGLREKCHFLKTHGYETFKDDFEEECGRVARQSLEWHHSKLLSYFDCH